MKRKFCPNCLADIEVYGDTKIICYCGVEMIDLNYDVRIVRKERKARENKRKCKIKHINKGDDVQK